MPDKVGKRYLLDLGCNQCGRKFPDRKTGLQEYMEHLEECDKVGKITQLTTNEPPDEVHRAHNEREQTVKRPDIDKIKQKIDDYESWNLYNYVVTASEKIMIDIIKSLIDYIKWLERRQP